MADDFHADLPDELKPLRELELSGRDPDSIRGIERLWIWRMKKQAPEIDAAEVEFFKTLQKQREDQSARIAALTAENERLKKELNATRAASERKIAAEHAEYQEPSGPQW